MKRYDPKTIEPKWQKKWDDNQIYKTDLDSKKPKYIAMSMFNYPSGAGIHIGHAMNYTISDVLARFKRQQGYESYHPVGWDAFGLPAENYAIKAGVSPQQSMATIIPNYHKQYKAMGWSNDWSKEISTHTPEYYKWTQWIFSEMYRGGLAYQDARMQWWCDKCQTVLANEQVINDKCWRHDAPDDPEVTQREVKQWFFKITDYADELLAATDDLNWTDSVKLAQKSWIGKSVGAEIDFKVDDSKEVISVFTTRIDTIFSGAFVVLAPEHELVSKITIDAKRAEVDKYVKESIKKSEVERQAEKEKTGVFTGAYAINPANQEKLPVWVGDFVLSGYGTGAVFGDIHDERDFEFIKKYKIAARRTVIPEFIDNSNPHREGIDKIEREVVQVIVKHPEEDKFLVLKLKGWDNTDYAFVTGGIDGKESPGEAAKREILEETGYSNIKETKRLDGDHYISFYHHAKKANVRAHIHMVSVELADLTQDSISKEEKALHEPVWMTAKEVAEKLPNPGFKYAFGEYMNGPSCWTEEGILIESGEFTGMRSEEAREKITKWLAGKGSAKEKVNFKMRDWSVSRQRYWGAPIPIVNCEKCGPQLLPDSELAVLLPELTDFQPSGDGRSALARAKDWLVVDCPKCGGKAERETDTLDTYICSSWYMLRYFDPENNKQAFSEDRVNKWMPIDFYNGADHATAHMLYARFITRFFHKKGLIDNPEPFKRFLFNGKVTAQDGQMFSKSKGNGVDPLEIIEQGYGADALRTYLMFAAPLDLWVRWDPQGVPGAFRFLSRLWTMTQEFLDADKTATTDVEDQLRRVTSKSVLKVTEDIEECRYNTAIATLMSFVNELYKLKVKGLSKSDAWKEAIEAAVMCVAPFAPFMAEELWHDLGHADTVHVDHWPQWDDKFLVQDTVTIVVQVNGKVRANVEMMVDSSEEKVLKAAMQDAKVATYLQGKDIKKVIHVPNKLVNIVI